MPGATTVPPAGGRAGDVDAVPLSRVPRRPDGRVDVDAVAAALGDADVLETAGGAGWSYVVPRVGARLTDDGTRTRLHGTDGEVEDLGRDPFAAIDRWGERVGVDPWQPTDPALPPCSGGLVGAFAYDLGRRIERVPTLAAVDRDQLHLSLRVAEVLVAVPPLGDDAVLVQRDLGSSPDRLRGLVDDVAGRVRDVARRDVAAPARPATAPPDRRPVTTSLPREAYLRAVEAVLAHVAAGDCFQVNLTQRLTTRWPAPGVELYRRLRAASPAPHAAWLPDVGVASVSPETFLEVTDGDVLVRPIKGTRPRDADPLVDAAHADDLATSAKDRAENVMVVDLERNDLGRVCVPGSVRVDRLWTVEAHPTVWHLVSDVRGRLASGIGYGDLLRATFPCGSITGAPKVRAMGIIEALEPVRRGWYCGALGFLAPGAGSLSVAIRTATRAPDGTVDHGVGGGIVADSDPAAEHAESLDKAAAFLRAVAGELTA